MRPQRYFNSDEPSGSHYHGGPPDSEPDPYKQAARVIRTKTLIKWHSSSYQAERYEVITTLELALTELIQMWGRDLVIEKIWQETQ